MDLDALRSLVTVVELGSMNQAAAHLGIPRATLSRRLAGLEASLGTSLLITSRDGSTPTPAGTQATKGAREILHRAAALEAEIRMGLMEPGRPLNITISPGFQPKQVALVLMHLQKRRPGLAFNIKVTAHPLSGLIHPDLIIGFGRPKLGAYRVTQLVSLPLALKASPAYLKGAGTPKTLEDLEGHQLYAWDEGLVQTKGRLGLCLSRGGHFPIEPAVVLNDIHQLHVMAQEGLCIALVPNGPFDAFQPKEVEILQGSLGNRTGLWIAIPEVNADLPWMKALVGDIRSVFKAFGEI